MTRHTVVWSQQALDQLTRIWMAAEDSPAITAASHAIDQILSNDPETKGDPWKAGLRILEAPPLSALFIAQGPDRLVRVIAVRIDQPPPVAVQTNGIAPSPS